MRAACCRIFLLAAAVHECGHLFVIRLSGGSVHALCLTACGAVLRCSLPPSPFQRAAICLAGPAASFALTALANPLGAYRLAGASALLGLFNLLPIPPLDGGMALRHLADGRFTRLLNGIAGVSVLVLLAGGVLLWKSGFGGWLFLAGLMVDRMSKNKGINQMLDTAIAGVVTLFAQEPVLDNLPELVADDTLLFPIIYAKTMKISIYVLSVYKSPGFKCTNVTEVDDLGAPYVTRMHTRNRRCDDIGAPNVTHFTLCGRTLFASTVRFYVVWAHNAPTGTKSLKFGAPRSSHPTATLHPRVNY